MEHKLIVDLFAGGGGASMGIEMALGRSADIAINHDPVAIAMHAINHPETEHYCNDIWAVDPDDVRPGKPIGLLWASPDCKHFSKAKGGKPKNRNIRDLAWVIVDWAEKRKPDVIIVENVEEFRTWGPLDNEGKIIPEFSGQTFEDWVSRLKRAGYRVDWRESRASSYGAPTIRKRLCIIASRIGRPQWPQPTHGDPAMPEVRAGKLLPWRTAAEDVIDWSLVCPSIFDSRQAIWERHGLRAVRPLAHNTGARVARGIRRYVLDAQEPFIVTLTHGVRTEPANEPLRTVTGANRGEKAIITPVITHAQHGGSNRDAREPYHTIAASKKDQNQVAVASLVQTGYGERHGQAPRALDPKAPLGTAVAGGAKHAPVAAFLAQQNTDRNGFNPGRPADKPVSTVTSTGAQQNVVAAHVTRQFGTSTGHAADKPTGAVTAGWNKTGIVSGALVKYYGTPQDPRTDEPLHTVTATDRFGLAGLALDAPPFASEHEARARDVADFMRLHGQWDDREFVTLEIGDMTFVIVDIGLRMLTPRELFNAQGFPPDYRIERDNDGNRFSKSDQVGRAGNSVSPPWAAAHVAANCNHLAEFREAAE